MTPLLQRAIREDDEEEETDATTMEREETSVTH